MARLIDSFRSTCLISTLATLTPHSSVCASMMSWISAFNLSRSDSISSSSCLPSGRRCRLATGPTTPLHRCGLAQMGGGCDGSDMAGIENIGAGTGRTATRGADPGDHRYRRGQDTLADDSHGINQTARRIQLDDNQGRLVGCRLLDTAHKIIH